MARYSHTIELQKVTPAQAKKWLTNNRGNRALNERTVMAYALDMEKGDWQTTGDPIRIDKDGNLIDGQHRLEACVLTGVPFWTYVMLNADPKVQQVIDTGRRRSMGDILKMMGYTNCSQLAAAINWCLKYQEGTLTSKLGVTHNQSLAYLEKNPGIVAAVNKASSFRSRLGLIPASIMTGIYFFTAQGDPDEAERFWKSLATGVGLHEREPVYAYRRWLERNWTGDRRASMIVQAAIAIKAWNAFVEGRELTQLTWKPAAGEEFPRIIIPYPPENSAPEPGLEVEPPPVLPLHPKNEGVRERVAKPARPAV